MAIKHKHVKAVIQLRRATEQEWYRVDPVLRMGEPALSTDVYKLKIGDGETLWSDLPYLDDDGGGSGIPYKAGNGIDIRDRTISLDRDLIFDCGTSTTVI